MATEPEDPQDIQRLSPWPQPPVDAPFEPDRSASAPVDSAGSTPIGTRWDSIAVHRAATSTINIADGNTITDEPASDDSAADEPATNLRTFIEWVAVIASALAIALLIKAYLVQAFEIPSGSMQSTLNIGDRILVNKLSYEFGDVERGNLIVFSKLDGTQSDTDELIKRVIALPGETVEVRDDGLLRIWGPGETEADARLLEEPYLNPENALLASPRLTDTPDQNIWHANCTNPEGDGSRCTLDRSSYYGMGDNRNASTDSRSFGPIPEENLVGRAFARIWPFSAVSGL